MAETSTISNIVEPKVRPFGKSIVGYGDCVILVTGKSETRSILVSKDGVSQTRFGALRHNDCVGKQYGSKVTTSKGHLHILPLTPQLWSASLPHRTQIIYASDASLIVGYLDLVPGKRVFESGTGSASLTHFLAQAVWPTGRVASFEFHAGRVEQAQKEFEAHSLSDIVSISYRDACSDGFPVCGEPENPEGVDAVVLDLPQPWTVVPKLPAVYRSDTGGRFCSFSPCFEQVQRTHLALTEAGFVNAKTVECLQRGYDVVRAMLNVPNMGQFGAANSLSNPRHASHDGDSDWSPGDCLLFPPPHSNSNSGQLGKKRDTPDGGDTKVTPGSKRKVDSENDTLSGERKNSHGRGHFTWEAMLQPQTAGHTGYLTFASWSPNPVDRSTTPSTAQMEPDLP